MRVLGPSGHGAGDPALPAWEGPRPAYGRLSGRLSGARTRLAARFVTGGSVLDAGCNIAELADAIPPNVDYFGLEVVPEIVELARRLHPDRRFALCDLEQAWPEEVTERRFDHVVLLAVLEHLKRPAAVLRQARAVLAPGGTIILTTPHPRARRLHGLGARLGLFSRDADEEHEQFLDRDALAALALSAGLTLGHYRGFLFGLNQLAVLRDAG